MFRAVLAPQAMEHRDDHIHMHLFHMAFRSEQDHAMVGAVRADRLDSSPTYMELVPTVISLMSILMISTQAADAGPNRNRAMMDGTSLKSTL